MLLQNRFFKICLGIICLLLIIFLISKVSFVFKPFYLMFNVLIIPFILSGFFYYLLRPLVSFLTNHKVNLIVAILFVYFLLTAFAIIFIFMIWPLLQMQVNNFVNQAPEIINSFQEQIGKLEKSRVLSMVLSSDIDLSAKLSEYLTSGMAAASDYLAGLISVITSFVIIIATVPIVLYYMLKGSGKPPSSLIHLIPRRYRKDGKEVIEEIDAALSGFIVGRVIITVMLGAMMYIGFLLIGLPFSLLLAIVSMIFNLIPYIGPIVGGIPVMLVAFTDSTSMAIWAFVVMLIAQQVEETLLSPHIYGKRLDIHPLTTVILLLVAGDIAGVLGFILAIPIYMVAKIIIVRFYSLFLEEKVEELVE